MNTIETALQRLIDLTDSLPPVSETDIVAFEGEIGARLPADYRAFVLARNGGRLQFHNSFEDHSVVCLYGIDDANEMSDSSDGLRNGLEMFRGRVAEGFLPIGDSMGDDTYCLCLNHDRFGEVHVWDRSEEMTAPWQKTCRRLTSNFTQFLVGLGPSKYELKDLRASARKYREPFKSMLLWDAAAFVRFLDKRGDVNLRNVELETPLMLAARRGTFFTKQLLAAGAEIEARDEKGRTALHYAVECNSIDGTRLLLSSGANPAAEDREGLTPLYFASRSDRMVQLIKQCVPGAADIDFQRLAGELSRRELAARMECDFFHDPVDEKQIAFKEDVGLPLEDTQLLLLTFSYPYEDTVNDRDTPLDELLDLMPRMGAALHERPADKARYHLCRSLLSLAAAGIVPKGREITFGQIASCVCRLYDSVVAGSRECESWDAVFSAWSAERRAELESEIHFRLAAICAEAKPPPAPPEPTNIDVREQPLLFRSEGAGVRIGDSGFLLSIFPHQRVIELETDVMVRDPSLHLLASLHPCVYYLPEGEEPPPWYEKLKQEVPHARFELCHSIFRSVSDKIPVTRPDVTIGEIADCVERLYEAVLESSLDADSEEDVAASLTKAKRARLRRELRECLKGVCSLNE